MSRQHKNLRFIHMFILVMWLGALIYLGSSYTQLPHTVATHFTLSVEADAFGTKKHLWFLPIFFLILWSVMVGMIEAVPKVERFMKGNMKSSRKVQWLFAVLFFSLIYACGLCISINCTPYFITTKENILKRKQKSLQSKKLCRLCELGQVRPSFFI